MSTCFKNELKDKEKELQKLLAISSDKRTILNTLDDLADSTNYALGQFGFSKRTTDEVRRFVGNGIGNTDSFTGNHAIDHYACCDCAFIKFYTIMSKSFYRQSIQLYVCYFFIICVHIF